MHEAGKFEFLNLAGGFPAKRTLLVTAIPRCQKTSHPKRPAIKLPTSAVIITVYEPDPDRWIDFRRRI
jgi:hypothetical protein